jgi:hypothetical protein
VHSAAVPLHAPPQPPNDAPGAAVAVSVTEAPCVSFALHADLPFPHEIPPPETEPGPETATVSGTPAAPLSPENAAETLRAAVIATLHVLAEPLHAPPQPSNVAPVDGVAVRVMLEPAATLWVQSEPPTPHVIPLPVTVPLPVTETVSGKVVPVPPVKAAETVFAASIVTVQVVDEPAQAPPQALKPAPEPAVAVRVTTELAVSLALQPEPPTDVHAIPPPVTVPLPVTETASVKVVADCVNVAVRLWSVSIVTEQLAAVPVQAPPQPAKA